VGWQPSTERGFWELLPQVGQSLHHKTSQQVVQLVPVQAEIPVKQSGQPLLLLKLQRLELEQGQGQRLEVELGL
jgi:hypothetical protein